MLIKTGVPIVTLMRVDVTFWRRGYGKKFKKAMAALPTFPAFDLQGDLSQGWRKYMSRFENLLLAMNITNAIRKKAMLLHYVGEEVNEILDTLDAPEATEEEDVFRKAEKALREYFPPQRKNYEFDGLKGVINISDDILVFGVDDADHDANLEAALERIERFIFDYHNHYRYLK